VRLEMMQPVEGRKRFSGRLLGVGASDITLELENGRINLPIEDIHRARLAPDM
jgi:ribosome maturation factor RimP